MVQEFVYGVYASLNEAEAVVDELTGKGVSRSGIKLLANDDVINHAQTMTPIESIDDLTEKTSHWWEGLLDFFTFDSANSHHNEAERKIDFSGYKDNIAAGEVLVVVDGAYEDEAYHVNLSPKPTAVADEESAPASEQETEAATLAASDELSKDDEPLADDVVVVTSDVPLSDSPDAWVNTPGEQPDMTDTGGLAAADSAAVADDENDATDSTDFPENPLPESPAGKLVEEREQNSEPPSEVDLPNNLHNPLSGATMADEPGVNIEEFEHLTEAEVEQLDRVSEDPASAGASEKASEMDSAGTSATDSPQTADEASDQTGTTYGDPTIHQETVERNTRTFDNLRHPRENISPTDVQQTIDDIRDPK